jgi:hypothetical protein
MGPSSELHTYCMKQDLQGVEFYIEYTNKDPLVRDSEGRTAIFPAIWTNDHEIAQYLLEHAPGIATIPARDGTTPYAVVQVLGDSDMIALFQQYTS